MKLCESNRKIRCTYQFFHLRAILHCQESMRLGLNEVNKKKHVFSLRYCQTTHIFNDKICEKSGGEILI